MRAAHGEGDFQITKKLESINFLYFSYANTIAEIQYFYNNGTEYLYLTSEYQVSSPNSDGKFIILPLWNTDSAEIKFLNENGELISDINTLYLFK